MYQKCRHIKSNGSRCYSPALRDTNYCYFHTRLHREVAAQKSPGGMPLQISALEDRAAIQLAVAQVLNQLGSCRLDARSAGLFLYGLQIASQNVDHDIDIVPRSAVHSLTLTPEGEELAPEETVCDIPDDCTTCDKWETCEDYESEEEDEDEEEEKKTEADKISPQLMKLVHDYLP